MKVYYITFRPIRGISASVDYEYNIIINGRLLPWEDPDEPEFTDLLGAESPITLREDDSDDLFDDNYDNEIDCVIEEANQDTDEIITDVE